MASVDLAFIGIDQGGTAGRGDLHLSMLESHTAIMNGLLMRGLTLAALGVVAVATCRADEIQLKDGKTFTGVIVAYDNNMFKVKTDFGFIMVEKSKIAAIIPSGSDGKTDAKAAAKKPGRGETSQPEPVKVDASKGQPTAMPAVESTIEKAAPRVSNAPVRPQLPTASQKSVAIAPTIKSSPAAAIAAMASRDTPLAPPKEAETPVIAPEEVQGNIYTNHVYGFRMYKAPSWQLIEDSTALPNAIVAMGT